MRARGIKPGFFVNGDLVQLPPLARILFVGLWCMADREGRLKDDPFSIKLAVLPGDECNVGEMLDALAGNGFIVRYEVDGARYIQVENFPKHQTPHVKERESTIPAPDKHQTSTVQTPDQHPLTPDSGLLTPDSGLLTVEETPSAVETAGALVEDFHELCPSLPRVRKLTEPRKRRADGLRKELGEGVRDFLRRVEASDFLTGRVGKWQADFDWIIKPEHITRILEGSYDNRASPTKGEMNVNRALALVEKLEREEGQYVAH